MVASNDQMLRDACANALAEHTKAYETVEVCRTLGLDTGNTDRDPWNSKRAYVASLIAGIRGETLKKLAKETLDLTDDWALKEALRAREETEEGAISDRVRRELMDALDGFDLSGRKDFEEWLLTFGDPYVVRDMMGGDPFDLSRPPAKDSNEALARLGFLEHSTGFVIEALNAILSPGLRDDLELHQLAEVICQQVDRSGYTLTRKDTRDRFPFYELKWSGGTNVGWEATTKAIESFSENVLRDEWREATDLIETDAPAAGVKAIVFLESTMKHILDDLEVDYASEATCRDLYKSIKAELGLGPSEQTDPIFKQILGGCTSVVEGLGAARNKAGGHGASRGRRRLTPRHAELVVGLAGQMSVFLWRTSREQLDTLP